VAEKIVVGLVEDDPIHAELYSATLQSAGFECKWFRSAGDFRRRLGGESVDLLLLDWVLPDTPGIDLLDWLKHGGYAELPVIFLTANSGENAVVAALRAGADDYLAKPARPGELIARVRAVLRRAGIGAQEKPAIEAPPYKLDLVARRLWVNGEAIDLTDREFDLSAFLFRRAGRIVSRELVLSQVWNLAPNITTRTIDTHVSRLRKKLGLNGEHGWRLSAVYQHGYRLEQVGAGASPESALGTS
jgi:DNA-binding response OmpR family regulator